MLSGVAALSGGIGFGLALRLNAVSSVGWNRLSPQQSFPVYDDWPSYESDIDVLEPETAAVDYGAPSPRPHYESQAPAPVDYNVDYGYGIPTAQPNPSLNRSPAATPAPSDDSATVVPDSSDPATESVEPGLDQSADFSGNEAGYEIDGAGASAPLPDGGEVFEQPEASPVPDVVPESFSPAPAPIPDESASVAPLLIPAAEAAETEAFPQ